MYVTFNTSSVYIQKGEEESCHINSTKYIQSLTQFEFSSLVIKSMIARKRAFSLLPTPVPALSFIFGCAIFCLSNLSSSTRSSYKQEILQEVNISMIFFVHFAFILTLQNYNLGYWPNFQGQWRKISSNETT